VFRRKDKADILNSLITKLLTDLNGLLPPHILSHSLYYLQLDDVSLSFHEIVAF
jgi:hypothetical protein